MKKVNLGSGYDYIDGWINIDANADCKPDIIADLRLKLPLKTATVDIIKAYDILEHFTFQDADAFVAECRRVLKTGGVIQLRIPDTHAIFRKYKNDTEVMNLFLYGDTSETGEMGAHKAGYSDEGIQLLFMKHGFKIQSLEKDDTNFILQAQKIKKQPQAHIHIGIIQQSPDIGGAEMFMQQLAVEWKARGCDVTLATNSRTFSKLMKSTVKKIHTYSVVVDVIGDWKGLVKTCVLLPLSAMKYISLLMTLQREGVHVLIMSEFSEKLVVTPLAKLLGLPVVWVEYGRPSSSFKRNFPWSKILFRIMKNMPERVITPTELAKKSLMLDGRVSLSKIRVIPCGTRLSGKEKSRSFKKGRKIIGLISRLTREKGQDYAIRALADVLKKQNAELWISGKGPDESYFRELVRRKKLLDYVQFPGFVKNIDDVYKKIDLFVFPTMWEMEGFGLVIIEAMKHGVPIVAFDTGPVKEVIQTAGIVVGAGDEKALADAVHKLLTDQKLYERLSRAGISLVKERYSIAHSADQYLDVLSEAYLLKSNKMIKP